MTWKTSRQAVAIGMLGMDDISSKDLAELSKNADRAADFLKALANRNRLTILCLLSQGERSVSDLEAFLGIRQPTLSQQLAVLREENLVATRRDGKAIYYRLASQEAQQVIGVLYELFCKQPEPATRREKTRELALAEEAD